MKDCVVIGGGIAGICAAIFLARKKHRVTVIERNKHLGGLLSSVSLWGHNFDLGTHVPRETGDKHLDDILFGSINDDWVVHPFVRVGNFFNGRYNSSSHAMDITSLKQELYEKAFAELLAAETKPVADCSNLRAYLLSKYGGTLTREVFAPVCQKFFSSELEDLAPEASAFFGMGRVIPADADTTRELKKVPELDSKLSFTSYLEGYSPLNYFYPRQGGVGLWVENLVRLAEDLGVVFKKGSTVTALAIEDRKVVSVEVNREVEIRTDALVITVPPIFILDLLKPFQLTNKPRFIKTVLLHFLIDGELLDKNFYFNCFDPDFDTFRVTLYSNLREQEERVFPVSVELLLSQDDKRQDYSASVFQELKRMGTISASSVRLESNQTVVPFGFPVINHEFLQGLVEQKQLIRESFDNACFLGKASGKSFFMKDVLREVFDEVNTTFG